jgi:hypothetical protein
MSDTTGQRAANDEDRRDEARRDERVEGADGTVDGGGEVSETGLGGTAPDGGADAVPSEHTTPGQDGADV